MKTKVIFRVWNGNVIALLPELAATMDPRYCDAYQHVGQHSTADPNAVIYYSRPATPAEYADLKRELESYYEYELEVVQKHTRAHYDRRLADIKAGQGL